MNWFLNPGIDWSKVGTSVWQTVLATTASGLMVTGKILYIAGAQLQHYVEEMGK